MHYKHGYHGDIDIKQRYLLNIIIYFVYYNLINEYFVKWNATVHVLKTVMSDNEDEVQGKTVKITIIGEPSTGKVSQRNTHYNNSLI